MAMILDLNGNSSRIIIIFLLCFFFGSLDAGTMPVIKRLSISYKNNGINEKERDIAYNLLLKGNIVSSKFSKKEIFYYKEFKSKEGIISFIKTRQDKNLLIKTNNSPTNNFIILRDSSKIIRYKYISSIDEDDFNFSYKLNDSSLVFNFFSVPVGYTKLYIVSSNNNAMYSSENLDQSERILPDSFDLKVKSFNTYIVGTDTKKTSKRKLLDEKWSWSTK